MTFPTSGDMQADYEQILNTWRFQDNSTKESMVDQLKTMTSGDIDKALAMDALKLIDEIETELRLEELGDSGSQG
jgi:hypothetical protein